MNIRDLEYLVTVADNLHFRKAAEICHVSQPTLSMQLKKLEGYLGVQLFERTNKTVMLTPIGKEITIRARQVLEETGQIREVARAAKDPFAGELKLGIFPTLAPYLLPTLMPKLSEAFPRLNMQLVEEKTPELIRRLNSGEIDCAVLAMPVSDNNFNAYKLFEEPFLLAVSAMHPVARRKSVNFADIAEETMLLLEDGHCLREQALDICHNIGIGEARNFRATSMTTLLQMVAAGKNVTLVPKLATLTPNEYLRYIPFKSPAPSRTIGLYMRSTSAKTPLYKKMTEVITQLFKSI